MWYVALVILAVCGLFTGVFALSALISLCCVRKKEHLEDAFGELGILVATGSATVCFGFMISGIINHCI